MPRAPKSCGRFGCDEYVIGRTYCPEHEAERQREHRSPSSIAHDSHAERRRRAAVVAAWVRINGWVCPGWQRDPHPSDDLTAAHVVAVAHGGGEGPLSVLCRRCNGQQGTRAS